MSDDESACIPAGGRPRVAKEDQQSVIVDIVQAPLRLVPWDRSMGAARMTGEASVTT